MTHMAIISELTDKTFKKEYRDKDIHQRFEEDEPWLELIRKLVSNDIDILKFFYSKPTSIKFASVEQVLEHLNKIGPERNKRTILDRLKRLSEAYTENKKVNKGYGLIKSVKNGSYIFGAYNCPNFQRDAIKLTQLWSKHASIRQSKRGRPQKTEIADNLFLLNDEITEPASPKKFTNKYNQRFGTSVSRDTMARKLEELYQEKQMDKLSCGKGKNKEMNFYYFK